MGAKRRKGDRGGVVIRKEEIIEGGHHGGAWKVAYADFVTAMMAFFLLMWLLNATTEAQRKGLADYFTPSNALSHASSGSGQPFGGHTPYDSGNMVSDRGTAAITPGTKPPPPDNPQTDLPPNNAPPAHGAANLADKPAAALGNAATSQNQKGARAPGGGQAAAQAQSPGQGRFLAHAGAAAQPAEAPDPKALAAAALKAELARREAAAFKSAAAQIRDAVRNDPHLAALARQIAIDETPEGLRIQLMDEEHQPMFATGSATPDERAKLLLEKIAPILARLPESISIAGHTDAAPYKGVGMSNWELSAERANATRHLLMMAGLPDSRFRSVTGNADRDLLLPADPLAAANRRIAILVLRGSVGPRPGK
ncbi:MAG: OmpA family protein [Rhodospirillales bacterium]|nr:OmpA family protein [Rhodospirillales bacterium]